MKLTPFTTRPPSTSKQGITRTARVTPKGYRPQNNLVALQLDALKLSSDENHTACRTRSRHRHRRARLGDRASAGRPLVGGVDQRDAAPRHRRLQLVHCRLRSPDHPADDPAQHRRSQPADPPVQPVRDAAAEGDRDDGGPGPGAPHRDLRRLALHHRRHRPNRDLGSGEARDRPRRATRHLLVRRRRHRTRDAPRGRAHHHLRGRRRPSRRRGGWHRDQPLRVLPDWCRRDRRDGHGRGVRRLDHQRAQLHGRRRPPVLRRSGPPSREDRARGCQRRHHREPPAQRVAVLRLGRRDQVRARRVGQPGVRTVIVEEGENDIWDSEDNFGCGITPKVTAEQLIAGYRSMIAAAHARGVRIVGGTITPFKADYMQPDQFARAEAIRDQVNHWIRTSGEYDAVADFARAVADPADPQRINPAYDSGDHLHPDDAGYEALAVVASEALPGRNQR
ncbi:GDSL-type esterase/lipase family protein [Kribbella sp. NPDC049227]|uniref:GDSL-type esterase/lipase family protein n=1 Tax=Kribbella sp. NPDC049227 TaxID=3364113 RepID=UPI0037233DDD